MLEGKTFIESGDRPEIEAGGEDSRGEMTAREAQASPQESQTELEDLGAAVTPAAVVLEKPDPGSTSHTPHIAAESSVPAESSPPALAGEGGGEVPPNDPPGKGLAPEGGEGDSENGSEKQAEEGHSEAQETDESLEDPAYAALIHKVLAVKAEVRQEEQATFRVIDGDGQGNVDVIITKSIPRETAGDPDTQDPGESPKPKTERVAFSATNPEQKMRVQELTPDHQWREESEESTALDLQQTEVPTLLGELAKQAPSPGAMAEVTKAYVTWMKETPASRPLSAEMPEKDRKKAQQEYNTARMNGAKHIIFGAVRQIDIAQAKGEEVDVSQFLEPLSEIFADAPPQLSKHILGIMMLKPLIESPAGVKTVASEWTPLVSKRAVCMMTAELSKRGVLEPNALVVAVVPSGRIITNPEIEQAFRDIVMSDQGEDFLKIIRNPQAVAEKYMMRLLESYADDPERHQNNVQVLIKAAEGKSYFPLPKLIEYTQAVARSMASSEKPLPPGTGLKDPALAGEAFLYLGQITRAKGEEGNSQYETDRRHAEMIGSLTGFMTGRRKQENPFIPELFDRPDMSVREKAEIVKQYRKGRSPREIYARQRREANP